MARIEDYYSPIHGLLERIAQEVHSTRNTNHEIVDQLEAVNDKLDRIVASLDQRTGALEAVRDRRINALTEADIDYIVGESLGELPEQPTNPAPRPEMPRSEDWTP